MKGVNAVAQVLKLEGVEYLFSFPANSLIDAAAGIGIRPILARSEKTLVNMADGYSRVSNGQRVGVVVVQQGPGVENAFGGVAQAFADSVPILVLPGGVAQRRLGVPTHFDPLPSYQHVTKWAARVTHADRVTELLRRAFTQLRTGQPGPVLVELPQDVAGAELPDAEFSYKLARGARSAGDPADVAEAVRLLLAAKCPVLHAGHGVLWARAWDELRELAELVQAPVMTTMAAKSAFPEDHPLALGTGGLTVTAAAHHFLKKADLVFGIGCSFSKGSFSTSIPAGRTMVQVTVHERDVSKDYPVDLAVLGDARLVLGQLIEEARRQLGSAGRGPDAALQAEVRAVREAWLEEWLPRLTSDETPINPYRVIWDLAQTVDRQNTIVTHDSGNPRDQMLTFYPALAPRGYLGWGKSTQLGTSLGLAMGAKLAAPEKLVVNVMGDLAFGMAGMDVETAARERIPILTIILNNSVLGGYGHHMPTASSRYGANRLSGEYAPLARALGAFAERVEGPAEVVPAIRRGIAATQAGRPAVLEMITKEEPVFSRY